MKSKDRIAGVIALIIFTVNCTSGGEPTQAALGDTFPAVEPTAPSVSSPPIASATPSFEIGSWDCVNEPDPITAEITRSCVFEGPVMQRTNVSGGLSEGRVYMNVFCSSGQPQFGIKWGEQISNGSNAAGLIQFDGGEPFWSDWGTYDDGNSMMYMRDNSTPSNLIELLTESDNLYVYVSIEHPTLRLSHGTPIEYKISEEVLDCS